MASQNTLTTWTPQALAVLRIVTALIFMEHGTQKLFGFPVGPEGGSTVQLMSLMGLAGILEFFGGILILIGLFTRPTAFVLAGFMAVAYFMAHAPQSVFPALNGGDAAILYCFVFLYLFFAGPGAWSLDGMRGRLRNRQAALSACGARSASDGPSQSRRKAGTPAAGIGLAK